VRKLSSSSRVDLCEGSVGFPSNSGKRRGLVGGHSLRPQLKFVPKKRKTRRTRGGGIDGGGPREGEFPVYGSEPREGKGVNRRADSFAQIPKKAGKLGA